MSSPDQLVGTRSRLLAAARTEFAAHGMGGARVDRIARAAGANKERIYGYFGSKEKLFAAVVAAALDEHAALLGPPAGDLGAYAGRVHDLHRANPELLRLMMWEALHYDTGALPAEEERRARYAGMVDSLARTLGTAPDTRAAATFLAVLGIAVLPSAFPQLARLIMGSTGHEGAGDAEARAYVVELARRLTPGAPKAP
ncbi:TetR family transcriptional regulator [Streptomyces sp. NBC_00102]|uniref:TetR family transcriptional regulator n=1 Tax=Streptomyces sp. NBC_00102 TaxID=2975652 RepID=UPI0022511400|nr:TetR family transcriptional regulator [Streptomyces sp. NBC_00102]MCX5398903.1 TetR family transcriptional regulator [Streptomyces sp. NBC_00102]